jgi:hypothetical protein
VFFLVPFGTTEFSAPFITLKSLFPAEKGAFSFPNGHFQGKT